MDAGLTTVDEVLAQARALTELPAAAIESMLDRLRQRYRETPLLFTPETLALLREASARARESRVADSAGPALAVLKDVFGYPSFRPGQAEIIDAVMGGRDCLAVMPTGAGKSVTYQIPARLKGGVTLVVSPLISLMKDQVDAMGELGIRATFLNSSLDAAERSRRTARPRAGGMELLYAAPAGRDAPRQERHRRATGLARSAARSRLLLSVQSALARGQEGIGNRRARHDPAPRPGAPRRVGHRLLPVAQGRRDDGGVSTGTQGARRGVSRRTHPRGARKGSGRVQPRRSRCGVRHHRLRHGDRQIERALCAPSRHAPIDRRVLPGDRPRRPRRGARRLRAVLFVGGGDFARSAHRRLGR